MSVSFLYFWESGKSIVVLYMKQMGRSNNSSVDEERNSMDGEGKIGLIFSVPLLVRSNFLQYTAWNTKLRASVCLVRERMGGGKLGYE